MEKPSGVVKIRKRRKAVRSRGRRMFLAAAAAAVLLLGGLTAVIFLLRPDLPPPRILARYVARRSSGHNPAIEAAGRGVASLLRNLDRGGPSPPLDLPDWFGARAEAAAPEVDVTGVEVSSVEELRSAMEHAKPGGVIVVAAGVYEIGGSSLPASSNGEPEAPILVRARRLGDATLNIAAVEGFRVSGAYWRFENLVVRGVCGSDDDCEHAFHVVAGAAGTVIRNNDIRNFNAHIKINGENGRFPDNGVIDSNTLANEKVRNTGNPVTPIDLVAASEWSIEGNLIADFVKAGGEPSYGAFAKGAGRGNRFVRNMVLCERHLAGEAGSAVGISLGGGGTDTSACRDGRCDAEQHGGEIRGNLIAFCPDEGIYLNRAAGSVLSHNTLLDTAGVTVRYSDSTAAAEGNLVDGAFRSRDGGRIDAADNVTTSMVFLYAGYHPVRRRFADVSGLNLEWSGEPERRGAMDLALRGLCGEERSKRPAYGAFDIFEICRRD